MKKVVWFVGFAFLGTSATRFYMIYSGNSSTKVGILGLWASYCPAFVYYSHHSNKYTEFIAGISERYRERIRDN